MQRRLRPVTLCCCLTALAASVMWRWPVVPASADDEAEEPAGATLDPNLQWRMADSSWKRREYDDAATLAMAYATANPDEPNALEAWWRAYEIYRAYRPNPERKKNAYGKGAEAAARWARKNADANKERASQGLAYGAQFADREGLRSQAISLYQDLVKKYPGTTYEQNAYWALGEWMRESKRPKEAIGYYEGYRKVVGVTEWGGVSWIRTGVCYEELGDKESAVQAYRQVLNAPYNWGGRTLVSTTLDAANRLKAMKEDEAARLLALRIIDKAPKNWTDFQAHAKRILGETQARFVSIQTVLNYTYSTDRINIDGGTKLNLSRDWPILVRFNYFTKEAPFKGKLSITPQVPIVRKPENMTAEEGAGGKTTFLADIATTDAKGGVIAEWRYGFTEQPRPQNAPDDLNVTRKWIKQGPGWGECSIRIQSTQRWYVRIYLPNDKTNPNNLNNQPTSVEDGGKTFVWHPNTDLNQGFTIKFPVDVGAKADEFYPRVRLERHQGGRYPERSATGKAGEYEMPDLSIKLSADEPFPCSFSFPGYTSVTLAEVSK